MIEASRTINTRWNEWKLGELEAIRGCRFQEVIIDRTPEGFRMRLVFEKDLCNQEIVNMIYRKLPGSQDIIFDALNKEVASVVAEGTKDRASYLVTFVDGYWFRV